MFYGTNTDGATVSTGGLSVGLIQGSLDGVNTPDESAQAYGFLSAPRALIEVTGGNHYSITDVAAPEDATGDTSAAAITQAEGIDRIGQVSAEFLKVDLKNDATALSNIYSGGLSISGVSVQQAER
mgnify:FL=1